MRKIKLMADYGCFPLWESTHDLVGNINPNNLPISEHLKQHLLDWSNLYNKTLNQDNPIESGFQTRQDEEKFKQQGYFLLQSLRIELGLNYTVDIKL